jgi:predicted signal transduction protein with EAL and GGDEF domain
MQRVKLRLIQENALTTNNHSSDIDAAIQQNSPDRQYDALSDDFDKGAINLQPPGLSNEVMMPTDEVGLPSRILPKERLIQTIAWEKRRGTKLAVLFLDLDRFQTVNDSLGRILGDELRPCAPAEQDIHRGVMIGVSMQPDDGEDAETLIRSADVAMYHTENRAGNSYTLFTPGVKAGAIE